MMKNEATRMTHEMTFAQLARFSLSNCIDDKVAVIEGPTHYPLDGFTMSDFIALIFCTEGSLDLDLESTTHHMQQDDILFCSRQTTLRSMVPDGAFHGLALCISWEYAQRLFLRSTCLWNSIMQVRFHPLLHPKPHEQELLRAYHRLLVAKVKNYYYAPQGDVDYIFQGFFHDFHQMIDRHAVRVVQHERRSLSSSRKEEIFKRFITLLKENHAREHFTAFYADALCVTPKYLTAVVKEVSGRSVPKWIDLYLMEQVNNYLKNTHMTAGEIADRLNFSNNSFFGKFVKAQTGKSPMQLRQALR